MKISVVIPAYNAKNKIRPTIESILSQSLLPHEIIVVDDGSSDGTADYVQSLSQDILVVSQENGGPSKARNYGVSLASSDWVAFCDADDIWFVDKLRAQVDWLRDNPACGILFSNMRKELSDGAQLGLVTEADDALTKLEIIRLIAEEVLFPSTMIIKKELFLSLGGFNTAYRWAEDIDLVLRAVLDAEIQFIGEPLAIHKVYKDSLSRSVNAEKGNLCLIRAWTNFLKGGHDQPQEMTSMVKAIISSYYFDIGYHCQYRRRREYLFKSWVMDKRSVRKFLHLSKSRIHCSIRQ